MTISSEVRKTSPFVGDDVETTFPFVFKVFTTADVLVVRADSLGVETILTLTTHYTVTLNADQNASPGGDVVLLAPLATGTTLVIGSQLQELQPVDLTNQGGFYPSVINAALDRATIQIQQLSEKVDRSAKLPITSTAEADSLTADIVLLADHITEVDTVAGISANVTTVAGVSANVTTVAGIASNVTTVAGVSANVTTVAGISANVTTVAGVSANVTTVAGISTSVPTVAGISADVTTVAGIAADVTAVAANEANINAAVADLPALAAKVSKTGNETMTGWLAVPAGASGAQVPQAQEVGALTVAQRADIYRRANIIGTVTQSAGVPTGALIQYTANADGFSARFADGLQICWRIIASGAINTVSGAIYVSGALSGNWAQTFISTPNATVSTQSATTAPVWACGCNPTTTGFTSLYAASGNNAATANLVLMAIGRWF